MEIVARNRYLTTDGHTAHVSFKDRNGYWRGWIEGKSGNVRPATWHADGSEFREGRTRQNIVREWRKLLSFTAWVGAYAVPSGLIGDRIEVEFAPVRPDSPYFLGADMRASGKKFMAIAPVVIEPGAGVGFFNDMRVRSTTKENDQ